MKSIREAMNRRRAPFYLRRTKEAMVYFPERESDGTWAARPVFTKRIARTAGFEIDGAEFELYREITRFVKRQSRRAAEESRREELERQRAVTLQGVERPASALVLPHPESHVLDLRRLRQRPETEMTAMRVATEHERAQGRKVEGVSRDNLGYDLTSRDRHTGDVRLIEVKGLANPSGSVLLTPNERRVAEDRRDCYWLYVVTHGGPQ